MTETQKNLAIAGAVVLALWYAKRRAGAVLDAVNPTNPDNLANRGFNALYRGITGSEGDLGSDMAARVERGRENPPETTAGIPNEGLDFSKLIFWRD